MKKILLLTAAGFSTLGLIAQEQRIPLLEMESASTCPPCRPGNIYFEGQMEGIPKEEYVKIKYQWYFPGVGDPYCTDESVNRTAYYGVNGVPNLVIDGTYYNDHPQGGFTTATFNAAKAVPATYKLSGTYVIVGQDVHVNIKYTPLEQGTNARLFVAIIESETEKNKMTNGETKFYNVMKKMLPNDQGTDISSTALNTEATTTLSFKFEGEYRLPPGSAGPYVSQRINHATEHSVESFDNLKVVAWVQGSDKAVYQAANLTKETTAIDHVSNTVQSVSIYPNPTKSDINIKFQMSEADMINASIVSLTGKVVKNQQVQLNKGTNVITFDTNELPSGAYNIIIFDSKNNSFAQRVSVVK